jgi:hypothetical protein
VSLILIAGEQHRRQRKLLLPTFSASHLQKIAPIICKTVQNVVYHILRFFSHFWLKHWSQLRDGIQLEIQDSQQEVNMLNWLSRATIESIGRAGLGYNFNQWNKDKSDEYANLLKQFGYEIMSQASRPLFSQFI